MHDPCVVCCTTLLWCRYGIGQILVKQEKYGEALAHFELGAKINPASSVLRCCCGLALHKMDRLEDAARHLKVSVAAAAAAASALC